MSDLQSKTDGARRMSEYIAGWTRGAGIKPIEEGRDKDPDFMRGWYDGKKASRQMQEEASERYGTPIHYVTTAALQPSPHDSPRTETHE